MTADKTPDTTTPTTADLSKRLAACLRFRWLPGMLGRPFGFGYPFRIVSVADDGEPCIYVVDGDILRDCDDMWEDDAGEEGGRPDLDDPATLGALEFGLLAGLGGHLAFAQGCWYLDCDRRGAMILFDDDHNPLGPKARAEALVLALESYGAEGQR